MMTRLEGSDQAFVADWGGADVEDYLALLKPRVMSLVVFTWMYSAYFREADSLATGTVGVSTVTPVSGSILAAVATQPTVAVVTTLDGAVSGLEVTDRQLLTAREQVEVAVGLVHEAGGHVLQSYGPADRRGDALAKCALRAGKLWERIEDAEVPEALRIELFQIAARSVRGHVSDILRSTGAESTVSAAGGCPSGWTRA